MTLLGKDGDERSTAIELAAFRDGAYSALHYYFRPREQVYIHD